MFQTTSGHAYITKAEAAYIARVQKRTIERWLQRGLLRRYGYPGRALIKEEAEHDLLQLLRRHGGGHAGLLEYD
jgi:hypothetical protein